MEVALKIDVDTHQGLKQGVPAMAAMLAAEGVTASFFVSMGPDNSGKAVWRLFRNRGFLQKMVRTRAVRMYGWRTVLSGTLLPARQIALAFPEIMRGLVERGFEVGVHGYDHVRWQDRIDRLGESGLSIELGRALRAYQTIFGRPASSFAAPGWRASAASMRVLARAGLRYHSDTRGTEPFIPAIDGETFATPDIPTTLPTLDELIGREDVPADSRGLLNHYVSLFSSQRLNVHTVHAETEGMAYLDDFASLVRALKGSGARFVRLDQVAARLEGSGLPVCELVRDIIPGRAGWVAVQGPAISRETVAQALAH